MMFKIYVLINEHNLKSFTLALYHREILANFGSDRRASYATSIAMADSYEAVSEPVPISKIGERYLLFDVNVVTYLRRAHHICGCLMGSLPQIPQQNVFLGLPVELMPEEAKVLVELEVAYIVDDTAWHANRFTTFEGEDKKKYLDSLRAVGTKSRDAALLEARRRTETHLKRRALEKAKLNAKKKAATEGDDSITYNEAADDADDSLFGDNRSVASSSVATTATPPYAVTPTATCSAASLPQNPTPQPDPPVPSSYPLFKHLHAKGYFIMPGLRFGCNYNVYPGDPLRFHSHFLAVGYEWNQEIAMLDIIGGGRLGTAVKKGFLIGGADTDSESGGDNVRTFAIEWGGM